MFFNELKRITTNGNTAQEIVSKPRQLKSGFDTYDDYIANIFGLLGVTDYNAARRMTLEEYNLRLRGYIVQSIEKEYFAFFNAYADRAMKSQNKNGDYKYKNISEIYDKERRKSELLGGGKPVNQKLINIAINLQKYRKEGLNGI